MRFRAASGTPGLKQAGYLQARIQSLTITTYGKGMYAGNHNWFANST